MNDDNDMYGESGGYEIPDDIEGEPMEGAEAQSPDETASTEGPDRYPSADYDGEAENDDYSPTPDIIDGPQDRPDTGGGEGEGYDGAGTDGVVDVSEYFPGDDTDGFTGDTGQTEPDIESDAGTVEEDSFSPDPQEDGADGAAGEGKDGEILTTVQNDKDTVQPYEKKTPGSVIKSSKPSVLNRQAILYVAGGIAVSALIFATFILPVLQSNAKAAEQKKKQAPTAVSPADYYSLVPRSNARNLKSANGDETPLSDDPARFWDEEDDDEIIKKLPAVDERYQPQTPVRQPASPSGGGYVRPDTRNDRLHGKSIEGIKGITPSSMQYLSGPGQVQSSQAQTQAGPSNPYAQFGLPPKEDYMSQILAMQQQQQAQYYSGNNSYAAQNDQSGKMSFYNSGRDNAGNGGYWLSPASIWQGTIFEAALTSRINTDLPGECTALITKNVYSSQDGKYLLIPQNSRLLGTYNSSVSYSQKRVQVGWHTLIRPDGYYINLGNMQAADSRGAAGLPGIINEHPFQYLKAIVLLSAMNIVNSELGYSMADSNNQYVQNVLANTQEIANTLGAKIIDRALDVQPTITIKEGTKINIVANGNLALPPMKPYPVTYQYRINR
jgi:type IV secretion system protein VirB10